MNGTASDPQPSGSDAARNERIKLTANFLNTVASGSVVVGGIMPIAAVTFGIPAGPTRPIATAFAIAAAFMTFGVALHWVARLFLGRLK